MLDAQGQSFFNIAPVLILLFGVALLEDIVPYIELNKLLKFDM